MESVKDKQSKTAYLTLLSVISAISVVYLHANCFWTFSTERYWVTANMIESVFYFAVPIFFMISGATLLNFYDRYTLKQYAVKRIKKAVIPFIVWSLIGLGYNVLLSRVAVEDITVKYVINGILGTSIINVYWFFTSLFGVYLCIPLLAAVEKEKRKEVFSYLAIACFCFNHLIPFTIKVFSLDINWPLSISVGSGCLLYVIIGYLLNEYDLKQGGRIALYLCTLFGLLVHMIGTYKLSMAAGEIVQTYKGYTNLPCIMYSVGIFVFFKQHGAKIMESVIGPLIRFLGNYTFGIYLVHIYILETVRDFSIKHFSISNLSLKYRLFAPILIIFIAVVIVSLLRKIPVIKHIVP